MPLLHTPSQLRRDDLLVLLTNPIYMRGEEKPDHLQLVVCKYLRQDTSATSVNKFFLANRHFYIRFRPYYEGGCHILYAKKCVSESTHLESNGNIFGRVTGQLDLDTYSLLTYLRAITKRYHRELWEAMEDFRYGS